MRKTTYLLALSVFLGITSCSNNNTTIIEEEPAPARPNIVFILGDQWRAQATGYSGDPNLIGKTPNLDRM